MKPFNFLFLILGFSLGLGSTISSMSFAQAKVAPVSHAIQDELNSKITQLQQTINNLSNDNQFLQIELRHQQQIAIDWKNHYDALVQNDALFYPARLFYWINRWSMTPLSQINIEGVPLIFVMGINGVLIVVSLVGLILGRKILADLNLTKKADTNSIRSKDKSVVQSTRSDFDSQTLSTQLDLARAYMDMGEFNSARDLLKEVLSKGDMNQQKEAKRLMEECQ